MQVLCHHFSTAIWIWKDKYFDLRTHMYTFRCHKTSDLICKNVKWMWLPLKYGRKQWYLCASKCSNIVITVRRLIVFHRCKWMLILQYKYTCITQNSYRNINIKHQMRTNLITCKYADSLGTLQRHDYIFRIHMHTWTCNFIKEIY